MDGRYQSSYSSFWVSYTLVLDIKGDSAEIKMGNRKQFKGKAKVDEERLFVYSVEPSDGLVFHIRNKGKTLECNFCEQKNFGSKLWEKLD